MSVSLYFGLPGCGKTTLIAALSLKALRSRRYKHVYCNVGLAIPGVTYIDNDCIGKYDLSDAAIFIDEGTLFADSRAHKEFGKDKIAYFLLHRHYNVDIFIFTQQWDGVDKKIRVITDRVFYVYKGRLLGKWFTTYYRIPYDIIIPDGKRREGGERLGEIIQGYCKPNLLVRLFSPKLYRPKYYQYFDSWECPPLPALPAKYKEFQLPEENTSGAREPEAARAGVRESIKGVFVNGKRKLYGIFFGKELSENAPDQSAVHHSVLG